MRILIDTNVVLDVLLGRDPWRVDAANVWKACDDGRVVGYVTATTLTNIYYVARKQRGDDEARRALELLLATFEIAPVDQLVLADAVELRGKDFEDDLQIACAHAMGAEAIVTRDSAGFTGAKVRVITPAEWATLDPIT